MHGPFIRHFLYFGQDEENKFYQQLNTCVYYCENNSTSYAT